MKDDMTRKGFWSVIWAGIVGIFASGSAKGATKVHLNQLRSSVAGPGLVGYGQDKTGMPVTVGAGLTLASGVLTASTPAPPVVPVRQYGVVLTRDPVTGSYPVPVEARNKIAVHRNGSRQTVGADYSMVGDALVFVPELDSDTDASVVVDGENM